MNLEPEVRKQLIKLITASMASNQSDMQFHMNMIKQLEEGLQQHKRKLEEGQERSLLLHKAMIAMEAKDDE